MKKLIFILSVLAYSCQKQYNCRCFIETTYKRTPLKDSTITGGTYEQAHYQCQGKNRLINDTTDVVCDIF